MAPRERLRHWIGDPPIPKEHGSWAMLLIPLAFGLALSGGVAPGGAWVAGGMLLLFLARSAGIPTAARAVEGRVLPPGHLRRRLVWTGVYGAAATGCLAAAWRAAPPGPARDDFPMLVTLPLALGLVHAGFGLAGRDRVLVPELVGMAGLAAAAPLVAAASGRPLDERGAGASALAFAYFLSSLAYVRAFRLYKLGGRMRAAPCVAVHAAVFGGLALLWGAGFLPPAAVLAFVTVLARTAWGILHPPANLRALGWRELGVAATFLAIAVAALATR